MDLVQYKVAKMMSWTNDVQPLLDQLRSFEKAWIKAKKDRDESDSKYIENESDYIDNILQAEYYFNRALEKHQKKFNRKNEPK